MIINGGSRRNSAFFAKHLTNGENNERVTLCELRNLVAQSVAGAFREMESVALGTLCRNYFYHANLNPREDEELTAEQWQETVNILEEHLGLKGHARFVVEHRKQGRTHRHVIWSRINVASMTAVAMTNDFEKHQMVARELEQRFSLERGRSVLGPTRTPGSRPSRRPATWESFRGQKSGIDPWAMKQVITELYRASKTGAEFASRLSEQGYTLLKGDRCDFVVRDSAGHLHSLARRIDGVSTPALRRYMQDLDPDALPSAAHSQSSTA